jgi:endonuclease/exonuclease/phosphatase family metal-dependent hydrolase
VRIRSSRLRLWRVATVLSAGFLAGCAVRREAMIAAPVAPASAACRVALENEVPSPRLVAWTTPISVHERDVLDAWCEATGPPVVVPQPVAFSDPPGDLVVITWNVHVGAGDLAAFVRDLRTGAFTAGRPARHFVLLAQEALRSGAAIPRARTPRMRVAGAIGAAGGRPPTDVVETARALGLWLYYAPSMRNGAPGETSEDRGNAILSTEPLSDLAAIELPFERQRRVAIAATLGLRDAIGSRVEVRVISAHLDSLASARRLWVLTTGARARQARGLLDAVEDRNALVLGGDLNSWFGFSDPGYRTIARAIPDIAGGDPRPTFGPFLRLDHLFSRLPAGWTSSARRLDDRFGSDHYPIVARLTARAISGVPRSAFRVPR